MSIEIKCKSIRFVHPIEDPHKPHSTLREEYIPVLRQGSPARFTVSDDGGFLKITGKSRSVWTHKANAIALVPDEESAIESKKAVAR